MLLNFNQSIGKVLADFVEQYHCVLYYVLVLDLADSQDYALLPCHCICALLLQVYRAHCAGYYASYSPQIVMWTLLSLSGPNPVNYRLTVILDCK